MVIREGAPTVRLFSWAEIVMFPQLVACCNVDYDLFRHTLENTRLSSLLFSGRIRYASKWDIYRNTFTFLYFFLVNIFLFLYLLLLYVILTVMLGSFSLGICAESKAWQPTPSLTKGGYWAGNRINT